MQDEKERRRGRRGICLGKPDKKTNCDLYDCIIDRGIISYKGWSSLAITSKLFWHAATGSGYEDKSLLPMPTPSYRTIQKSEMM